MKRRLTLSNIAVVHHSIQGVEVCYRVTNGYFNATNMCKALKKQWHDFYRLASTNDFIEALSTETGIPVSVLVETKRGGIQSEQGTWVHPQIAIHLAQWLSPQFAVKVSQWVFDWVSLGTPPKIEPSRSIKIPLNLDDMLSAGISLETTLIEVTHTKQGDVIHVNKLTQSSDSMITKGEPTVLNKPSWLLIVETFFDEIENGGIPEKMRQNMLLSKELISMNERHDCLFFRLSNLIEFFRKTPRFSYLIQESTIQTASILLEKLKSTGILAFNGKTKEKGIPVNPSIPSDMNVRRVSHLVAIDLVVLKRNYGVVMANSGKITSTFY
jgi:hypothetical protein